MLLRKDKEWNLNASLNIYNFKINKKDLVFFQVYNLTLIDFINLCWFDNLSIENAFNCRCILIPN